MSENYLTPEEAETLRLPVLRFWVRKRKIQEYASRIATGTHWKFDTHLEDVRTRSDLVEYAKQRQYADTQPDMHQDQF